MNILGICELLRTLAEHDEDEFVMSLMVDDKTAHQLLKAASYHLMGREDDPSLLFEMLVQKGHADAVGAVIVKEPELLQALKKIDRVLDAQMILLMK